jgi:hypothetical protein
MEMTQRLTGGRTTLQSVNAPDDIKDARANEVRANQLINELFEEVERDRFHALARSAREQQEEEKDAGPHRIQVPATFHEEFEKARAPTQGYSDWLKEDAGLLAYSAEGQYQEMTIRATIGSEKDLHRAFEATMAKLPPAASTALLLPDEMAYGSGAMGVSLIDDGKGYSSAPGMNPEFCDVYAAYTSENTVLDKIQPVASSLDHRPQTLEDLMAERDRVYECVQDEELEAIAAYERRCFEEEKRHKQSVTQYFSGTMKLIGRDAVEEVVESKADVGFCIQLGR